MEVIVLVLSGRIAARGRIVLMELALLTAVVTVRMRTGLVPQVVHPILIVLVQLRYVEILFAHRGLVLPIRIVRIPDIHIARKVFAGRPNHAQPIQIVQTHQFLIA